MALKIITNILGIAIYFLIRFDNRRNKSEKASFSYWAKDNWAELTIILLFDLLLIALVLSNNITINLISFVPEWLVVTGDATVFALIGLVISHAIYQFYKKAIKKK